MTFKVKTIPALILLFLLAFIFFNCSIFDHGTEWVYYTMYPHAILNVDSGGIGRKVYFELASAFNSSCDEFSHAVVREENKDYLVKFFQRHKRDARCLTVMIDTQIRWSFTPLSPGEYRFHFWQSDSTSLDTTIVIR